MGKKQDRRGKHFYLFLAFVTVISIFVSGCVHLYEELLTRPDFKQASNFSRQGNYDTAAEKYERIVIYKPIVGDIALYQLGLIYALAQNKHKDYFKALEYFQRLVKDYPDSRYNQNSDIFISLITEIINKDKKLNIYHKQINKLELQIEESQKKIEELEKKIEQIKEVDMNLKQKKKAFP